MERVYNVMDPLTAARINVDIYQPVPQAITPPPVSKAQIEQLIRRPNLTPNTKQGAGENLETDVVKTDELIN